VEIGEREFVFRPKEGLAFLVRDGREVTVSRAPDVSETDIYVFLMGSVWGVLCHQRELLPLHCSAIEFRGRAIAFTGPSGTGKSTLAAGMLKRGYPHLCDDVCIADQSGGPVRLWPMPKGLKLWGDAAEALDMARGTVVNRSKEWDKYLVPTQAYAGQDWLEISALYVLDGAEDGEIEISRLRGSCRFQEIMSNLYRGEWMNAMRDPAEVFEQVANLAQSVPVYRFSRPRDLAGFERGLAALEAHMHDAAAPT
jgi:hypothetical protein